MEAARELRSHVLTLWSLSTPAGFSSSHICPISDIMSFHSRTVAAVRCVAFDCDASPRQTQALWWSLAVSGDRCGRRGGSGAVALARSGSPCEFDVHQPARRQFHAVRGGVHTRLRCTPHRHLAYVRPPRISCDRGDRLRSGGSRLARRRPSPVHRSPQAHTVVNRFDAVRCRRGRTAVPLSRVWLRDGAPRH